MNKQAQTLIAWYEKNKRSLPWRETNDPYKIWISEIMLQQTTTDTVIPYYKKFIQSYPTINDLSQASLEEVYKHWEGLGYYRRAKHLHETALYIVQHYDGHFPQEYEQIISLKGIGPYTAGAISSIAFKKEYPAVDGNVLRIIARLYSIENNIALPSTQKLIREQVKQMLIKVNPSSLNQGFMDLGATVCKPKNPQCSLCPLSKDCLAYKNKLENVLPINIKNIKNKELHYITGIITYQDQFFIIKNPPGGLLENLYGFIQYNVESPFTFIEEFQKEYDLTLDIVSFIKDVKHVFSHRTWHMHVYHFQLKEPSQNLYPYSFLNHIPFSTAHRKVLKIYKEEA